MVVNVRKPISQYYLFIGSLKPWMRYALTGISALMIFSIWFFLLVRPLRSYVQMHEKIKATMQADYESMQHAITQQESMQNALKSLEVQVGLYAYSYGYKLDASALSMLIDAATKYNLSIKSYSAGSNTKLDWYSKHMLTLGVAGSYENIVAFLKSLQTTQYLTKISALRLWRVSDTVVEADLQLSLLSLKKDQA